MKKRDIYGKFYNPTKLLSYNKTLCFSIGARSIGKSTGMALHLLRDYLENGHQFIYVRRDKDELRLTCTTYFDSAVSILKSFGYNINECVYDGGKYIVDGEVAGYAIPLNLQQKYKSSNYEKVFWILYDEFIVTPGSQTRYIGGRTNASAEVDAMTSLYQTVDRGIGNVARNEVRILFVGNAGRFFNPFFINYGIDKLLRRDTKYLAPKGEEYVLEMTSETEATKEIKQSNGYKISTEKTRAYAYDNKFADLTGSDFIVRSPSGRHLPMFNFVYEGNTYGVLQYPDLGYVFISEKKCEGRLTLSLTTADHRPNYLMMQNWHGHPATQLLKECYDRGDIRFMSNKCKLVFDFYLSYEL